MKRTLAPLLGLALRALPLALALLITAGCGRELPTPGGIADGYDRVVLCELFTAVWCGNCPLAEAALDRLVEEEGTQRLAIIHWHPSIGAGDPFAFPQADARFGSYDAIVGDQHGLPINIFNGTQGILQGSSATYGLYRDRFDQEAQRLSTVKIEITPAIEGNLVRAQVAVSGFAGSPSRDLDLHVVVVEHHAPNPGSVGPDTLSYTARTATSSPITVLGGETATHTLTLGLDPGWKRENLYLVAFVQERTPAAGQTYREVLQAAMAAVVAANEDFYSFVLTTPELARGVTRNAVSAIPFRLSNTGTLDDTLTIDLPGGMQGLPAGWQVALSDADGYTTGSAVELPLAPGETEDRLAIQLTAGETGTAHIVLTVASGGDAALSDTLRFELEAGVFGVTLAAETTELDVIADTSTFTPLTLTSTGTLADSVIVTLPQDLNTLPAGWSVGLADPLGNDLGTPHTVALPAGAAIATLRLKVTAASEGGGQIALVAASRHDASVADTLRFIVESRLYAVGLSAEEPNARAVVGTPAWLALRIHNLGAYDDLITIDLPAALQDLPAGWSVAFAYTDGLPLATPYGLVLESAQTVERFALRVDPASAGTATISLTASSAGDPRAADTLVFRVTADSYGFEVDAPGGREISLEQGTPALVPLRLSNTGTLDDTLVLTMPAELILVPAAWEVAFTDAAGSPLLLPYYLPLATGAVAEGFRIRARATQPGSGSVGLVVRSTANPALADTLTLSLSALTLFISAPETTIHVIPHFPFVTGAAEFDVHNTGAQAEVVMVVAERLGAPPTWESIPIICDESGFCYGPETPPITVGAGMTITNLIMHWEIPGSGGTGTMRLKLIRNPAAEAQVIHTQDFTFTTAGRVAPGTDPSPIETTSR
jgi:hypothetical protein